MTRSPRAADYDRRVFINCPFDSPYIPTLHAVLFAVLDCGFSPQLAVLEVGGANRLTKITAMMLESRLSIHDISRLPVAPDELPRFNMPFECGLFVGIRAAGGQRHKSKNNLLMDSKAFRHLETLSDAAGLDPQIHGGTPNGAIACVRHFLASELRKVTHGDERTPGAQAIASRHAAFWKAAKRLARENSKVELHELKSLPYAATLISMMKAWIDENRPTATSAIRSVS